MRGLCRQLDGTRVEVLVSFIVHLDAVRGKTVGRSCNVQLLTLLIL